MPDTTTPPPISEPHPSPTLFDIPHIIQSIASHLQPQDLLRCCLVNYAWSTLFIPQLWQTFSFWDMFPPHRYLQPERFTSDPSFYTQLYKDTIVKNARFIRKLKVLSNVIEDGFLSKESHLSEGGDDGGSDDPGHHGCIALRELECFICRAKGYSGTPISSVAGSLHNGSGSEGDYDSEEDQEQEQDEEQEEQDETITYIIQPVYQLVHQNRLSLRLLDLSALHIQTEFEIQALTRVLQILPGLQILSLQIHNILPGRFCQDILKAVPKSCQDLSLGVNLGDGNLEPVVTEEEDDDDGDEDEEERKKSEAEDDPTGVKDVLENLSSFRFFTQMYGGQEFSLFIPFLKRLPNLKRIHFPYMRHRGAITFVASTLAEACPKIEDVNLSSCLIGSDLRLLLNRGCSRLKRVLYEEHSPATQIKIADLLLGHSRDTLQELDFRYSPSSVSAKDLPMILTSCSRLRALRVRGLGFQRFQEMVTVLTEGQEKNGQTWACASTLETLQLGIHCYMAQKYEVRTMDKAILDDILLSGGDSSLPSSLTETMSRWDIQMMEEQRTMALQMMQFLTQVGQLENLKVLHLPITIPSKNGGSMYHLPLFALLMVNTGLSQLGDLNRLEELNVEISQGSEGRLWGKEEVEWMTQPGRWPRLKRIQGWVHKVRGVADPEQDRQWMEMFKARRPGVELVE